MVFRAKFGGKRDKDLTNGKFFVNLRLQKQGTLAQLVEHRTENPGVRSSILRGTTSASGFGSGFFLSSETRLGAVFFHGSGSPAVCLRGSTSRRALQATALVLFRTPRNPSVSSAAPGTRGFLGPMPRAAPCFPSHLREPARFAYGFALVSLRASQALRSCSARIGAVCDVSSRPSEPFGLLGERRTRNAVSPSMFAEADNHKPGYSNRGRMFHCERAIYRAPKAPGMGAVMRRRVGIASSIKLSHQVLFFLPITALTILAIAMAMPSGLPALFSTKITATFPILYA